MNGLAAAFQAACNASSTVRLCHLLPLELSVLPQQSSDAAPAEPPKPAMLSGMVVQPAAPLKLTQLNRMRVLESMLSARLMRPAASDGTAGEAFRSGLLSIEQSRSLVLLLHGDPMVRPPLLLAVLPGSWVRHVRLSSAPPDGTAQYRCSILPCAPPHTLRVDLSICLGEHERTSALRCQNLLLCHSISFQALCVSCPNWGDPQRSLQAALCRPTVLP